MSAAQKVLSAILGMGLLVSLSVPLLASAQNSAPSLWPLGYWGPLVSCTGDYSGRNPTAGGPTNPCVSLCDVLSTAQRIIYFGMSIAIFIAVPILISYAGILFLLSGVSPDRVARAKKILTGTVMGIVITLAAFLIVNTFLYVVGNGTGNAKVSFPAIQCPP